MLTYGGLLVWIGIWFMMETIESFLIRVFWSGRTINPFKAVPYHFNDIIHQTRLE